jgi:FecR protein
MSTIDHDGPDGFAATPSDAADLADAELVRRLLERAGPRPPIPQSELDALTAHARSAWERQVRQRARASARRVVWPLITVLAAALALTVGAAWWAAANSQIEPISIARVEAVAGEVLLEADGAGEPIRVGRMLTPGAVLRSGSAAGRASVRLASGVEVRLDVGTRVRLLSRAALRLEEGAVYVDTGAAVAAAGGDRRLEVWTAAGVARDLGTQFLVRVQDSAAPGLSVQVREGVVEVERDGQSYETPAGRELLLGPDGTPQWRDFVGFGEEWAWTLATTAGFSLEGRTMEEFLLWVARETGWEIRYEETGLAALAKTIVLHGGLATLRADEAPFVVLPGAGWACERVGGVLRIRRPG